MKKYIFIIISTLALIPNIILGQSIFPNPNLPEDEGLLSINGRSYGYHYSYSTAKIYNTQNITSNDTTASHPIYSQYDECRKGYLNKNFLVSALKQIFTPARRQQLVNEYIYIGSIILRSTSKIQEVEFEVDKTTKMTLEEIFQLENLLKSQIHYQNPDDLWCQPYKMTYLFARQNYKNDFRGDISIRESTQVSNTLSKS